MSTAAGSSGSPQSPVEQPVVGQHDVQRPPAGRCVRPGRAPGRRRWAPTAAGRPVPVGEQEASCAGRSRPRPGPPRAAPARPPRGHGEPAGASAAGRGPGRARARPGGWPGPGVRRVRSGSAAPAPRPPAVPGRVGAGGGEPVVPVGDDRPRPRRTRPRASCERPGVRHPPQFVADAVGVGHQQVRRARSATCGGPPLHRVGRVVGEHDGLQVGAGRRQQRPATLHGGGERVLVRQHGRRALRRQRDGSRATRWSRCRPGPLIR